MAHPKNSPSARPAAAAAQTDSQLRHSGPQRGWKGIGAALAITLPLRVAGPGCLCWLGHAALGTAILWPALSGLSGVAHSAMLWRMAYSILAHSRH